MFHHGVQVSKNLLLQNIAKYDTNNIVNIELINKAIEYAKHYHGDQLRQTGESYWFHPVLVASMTAEYYCNTVAIVASILHDTLEDTELTYDKIVDDFCWDVAQVVNHLTNKTEESLEARINDIINSTNNTSEPFTNTILTIKLLDRTHNMSSLHVKKSHKRLAIIAETENILLPIAAELQLHKIYDELNYWCNIYKTC